MADMLTELARKLNTWTPREWESPLRSGVLVPYTAGDCNTDHPAGWVCTRRRGHTGRHAAAVSSGDVCAVWEQVPACRT